MPLATTLADGRDRALSAAFRRAVLIGLVVLIGLFSWPGAGLAAPVFAAAKVCTGWTSETTPPTTIRVYRTGGPAIGTVETVPFRQYVGTVLAVEFGASIPTEALRVGAIAVKQYAWYRAMSWRGKSAPDGNCYDVVDSTLDQLYEPEVRSAKPTQLDAIDATWGISVTRGGHLFAIHYQGGSAVGCGTDADGKVLYQQSLYACARQGMLFDTILHRYLDPIEIVGRPGAPSRFTGDVTGDGIGDVMVVSPAADPAVTTVRIYSAGKADPIPAVVPAATGIAPASVPLPPADTAFRQFVDVTGDRLDDMVVLQRAGPGYQLWLAAATGAGFGAPALLWTTDGSGLAITPTVLLRLVAGDFDGDGVADIGLLAGEPASPAASASDPVPTATLWLLRGTGTGLAPAVPWWSGPLNLQGTAAYGGDANGDGRADVLVQEDMTKQAVDGVGLRFAVISSGTASGLPPAVWSNLPDTPATAARTVIADVNHDGRADMVVDRIAGKIGTQLLGMLSSGAGFTPRSLWMNATSFRWAASRMAAADVNADGRDDIIVLYNAGAGGSRLYQFLSTGMSLRSAGSTTDPTLPWAGAAPY